MLARGEVRQDGCAHDVVAVEGTLTRQPQRADLLVVRAQRNHDRVLRRRLPRPLPRAEQQRARLEEPLRLLARPLQHFRAAGDRSHRLDERLEEARFARELLLRSLVPPALRHDQERGYDSRDRDRQPEGGEGQWMAARCQCHNRQQGRGGKSQNEQSGSSR